MPNDTTVDDGFNIAGYRFIGKTPLSQNTYIARLDYTASRNQLFLRGNLQDDKSNQLPQFPGQPPASSDLDHSKGMAAGWTSLIAPNLLSTFRYGFTRYGHEDTGLLNAPYVSFYGLDTLSATTTGLVRIIPVHQLSEDLAWTKGRHTMDFGGVVRIIRNRSLNYAKSYPFGTVTYGYLQQTGQDLVPADLSPNFSASYRRAAVDLLGPVTLAVAPYPNFRSFDALKIFSRQK
jgi:hypothetical protein